MEDTSLCDVLIELVDRYITEKQKRLRYCSELEKANARLEQYEEQALKLISEQQKQQERDENEH